MAATDTFDIKVRGIDTFKVLLIRMCHYSAMCLCVSGSGGHGAVPHAAVDAIVTAASLVTSLQTVISRNTVYLQ